MPTNKEMLHSYYAIRKIIGTLGLLLPLLVVLFHEDILASLSHYYYAKSSVFFTSILAAFGLFLISYKGYEKDSETEWLSDNLITHIGGFAVLLVVIFPTSCIDSMSDRINELCKAGTHPLFGHNHALTNVLHLLSAGIFLFSMGWMSVFRFTKGTDVPGKKLKNLLYRVSGYTIWVCMGILLIEFLGGLKYKGFYITKYDVIILETISVFFFGTSWLIKGKMIKDSIYIKNKIFGGEKVVEKRNGDYT